MSITVRNGQGDQGRPGAQAVFHALMSCPGSRFQFSSSVSGGGLAQVSLAVLRKTEGACIPSPFGSERTAPDSHYTISTCTLFFPERKPGCWQKKGIDIEEPEQTPMKNIYQLY